MNVTEAIASRRSIKYFDPDHRLTQAEENELFEATILSPTAFNLQHWRLVVVRDQALREKIRQVAWGQAQMTDASLLVFLCADLKTWEKSPEKYWVNAPQAVQDFIVPAIDQYYRHREQVQRDEVMRSCGLAGMTLMLKAQEMGYHTCPMDGFDFDAVGKIIHLPQDHVISFGIAIGKGTKEPWPRGGQLPLSQIIINNHF